MSRRPGAYGMLRWKHLFHPLRTARVAKSRLATQIRFRNDPRYDLNNVTQGFAPRLDDSGGAASVLERICRAYNRAVSQPQCSPWCDATDWWMGVRQNSLGPVMRALQTGDLASLRQMYTNFFRDRCSAGLIADFESRTRDLELRAYLDDALYRLDCWRSETGGRFALPDLAGPEIGNPFGVCLRGTLVRSGSEYQHYCAHRILDLLDGRPGVVAEIGGGYGGMAYYLLRDGGRIRYLDFDVPESGALTSFYLLQAFPASAFLFYGESPAEADVVLLPLFEMAGMAAQSVDLTFSSHVMADLSDAALREYLGAIGRMTGSYFLYSGDCRAAERIAGFGGESFKLLDARSSGWNRHIAPEAREGEYLYRVVRP